MIGPEPVLALPQQPGLVLVVDDDAELRKLVVKFLSCAGLSVVEASTGHDALTLANDRADEIDAMLLDVKMPGIDGYEVLATLKMDPVTAMIPVVLFSAKATSELDVVRAMDIGAADHLFKPFSASVLVAKVRAACRRAQHDRLIRLLLKSAETDATIDVLTQLHNRRQFDVRLADERETAKRRALRYALLCLDIDDFKSVNDTFGHKEGDRVLSHVAGVIKQTAESALKQAVRRNDAAFRYGGDEFAIVLTGCDERGAIAAGERLAAALRENPILLGEARRVITFSGGVAAADESNGFDGDRVVERADAALYRAKKSGRNRVLGESNEESASG